MEFLPAGRLSWACYLSPAVSSRIGSATSSWYPLAAQGRPRCCCSPPAAFASDLRNVVQRDHCWILVVTIPPLRDSCFFPIFSITLLPFSVSLIRIYNKLVGPTFEPLFLNLMPGIQILKEPHLPPINWSETVL